jgi:hypothetical protein
LSDSQQQKLPGNTELRRLHGVSQKLQKTTFSFLSTPVEEAFALEMNKKKSGSSAVSVIP